MILVISPLVEVAQPSDRSFRRAVVFIASLVASSTASYGLLGWVSSYMSLPGGAIWLAVLLAVMTLSIRELGIVRLPLPSRNWQVPRAWLGLGTNGSALAYGFTLGTGFLTRAPFSSYQTSLGIDFAVGSVLYGLVLGLVYGLVRGSTVLLPLAAKARSNRDRVQLSWWVTEHEAELHAINGLALAYAAGLMIGAVM